MRWVCASCLDNRTRPRLISGLFFTSRACAVLVSGLCSWEACPNDGLPTARLSSHEGATSPQPAAISVPARFVSVEEVSCTAPIRVRARATPNPNPNPNPNPSANPIALAYPHPQPQPRSRAAFVRQDGAARNELVKGVQPVDSVWYRRPGGALTIASGMRGELSPLHSNVTYPPLLLLVLRGQAFRLGMGGGWHGGTAKSTQDITEQRRALISVRTCVIEPNAAAWRFACFASVAVASTSGAPLHSLLQLLRGTPGKAYCESVDALLVDRLAPTQGASTINAVSHALRAVPTSHAMLLLRIDLVFKLPQTLPLPEHARQPPARIWTPALGCNKGSMVDTVFFVPASSLGSFRAALEKERHSFTLNNIHWVAADLARRNRSKPVQWRSLYNETCLYSSSEVHWQPYYYVIGRPVAPPPVLNSTRRY